MSYFARLTAMVLFAILCMAPAHADPRIAEAKQKIDSYDLEAALELLDNACDDGVSAACVRLLGYSASSFSDEGVAEAKALAEPLCEAGNGPACAFLAEKTNSFDDDPAKAAEQRIYWDKACQRNIYAACTRFAGMASSGEGGPEDEKAARAAVNGACDAGYADACLWAGDFAKGQAFDGDGDGTAAYVEARTWFTKACDGGSANGCARLARMKLEGQGGDADFDAAMALYQKGCAGATHICQDLLEAETSRPFAP